MVEQKRRHQARPNVVDAIVDSYMRNREAPQVNPPPTPSTITS